MPSGGHCTLLSLNNAEYYIINNSYPQAAELRSNKRQRFHQIYRKWLMSIYNENPASLNISILIQKCTYTQCKNNNSPYKPR